MGLCHLPAPRHVICPYCKARPMKSCTIPSTGKLYLDCNGTRHHAARYREAGHKLKGRSYPSPAIPANPVATPDQVKGLRRSVLKLSPAPVYD